MDFSKEEIIKLLPEFIELLKDDEFKNNLIAEKNKPENSGNPLALVGIIMPHLSKILSNNGYTEPDAAQKFIGSCMMQQGEGEMQDALNTLKSLLIP